MRVHLPPVPTAKSSRWRTVGGIRPSPLRDFVAPDRLVGSRSFRLAGQCKRRAACARWAGPGQLGPLHSLTASDRCRSDDAPGLAGLASRRRPEPGGPCRSHTSVAGIAPRRRRWHSRWERLEAADRAARRPDRAASPSLVEGVPHEKAAASAAGGVQARAAPHVRGRRHGRRAAAQAVLPRGHAVR